MTQVVDIAVIGAGMFGSAAAKYLARAGADVLLIGPAEAAGPAPAGLAEFAAHFDQARICRRLGWDQVWAELDSRSLQRFRGMEADSGIGFFHERGSLVLMAGSIRHRTNAIADRCRADGITVQRMSESDLRAAFPALGLPRLTGGVEGVLERDHAGWINPRHLVAAQLALAVGAGARLRRGVVDAVTRHHWHWKLRVRGQGHQQVLAGRVLVAAGALTNETGALPDGHRLSVRAYTEPNLLFELGDADRDRWSAVPPVVTVDPDDTGDANMSLYLLPPIRYPDGRWYRRIGPGMQPCVQPLTSAAAMRDWYTNQTITDRQHRFLTRAAHTMAPGAQPRAVRQACCIIEKTATRYPYIGRLDPEDDTLAVAVGGNGHGARGSDEIGRLAANTILATPWDSPIPERTFTPAVAGAQDCSAPLDALKPPFGLC